MRVLTIGLLFSGVLFSCRTTQSPSDASLASRPTPPPANPMISLDVLCVSEKKPESMVEVYRDESGVIYQRLRDPSGKVVGTHKSSQSTGEMIRYTSEAMQVEFKSSDERFDMFSAKLTPPIDASTSFSKLNCLPLDDEVLGFPEKVRPLISCTFKHQGALAHAGVYMDAAGYSYGIIGTKKMSKRLSHQISQYVGETMRYASRTDGEFELDFGKKDPASANGVWNGRLSSKADGFNKVPVACRYVEVVE